MINLVYLEYMEYMYILNYQQEGSAMRTFSTVELTQQIGTVTHVASREPVAITQHRKPRFILMSIEDYEKMQGRGRPRRVYGVGETPPELADMLATELEQRINDGSSDYDD